MKDRKLAAIVFTDIVGYTKRMEKDEAGTMKLLARQRELLFPMVKEFGGEVIKEIGDGLLMMFTSANRAVRFAMTVQEKLKDEELTIRAGIHIGDVIFEDGDVFGSAVNIAARIEPLAPAGGICISEDVRSQIRNQGDIHTVSVGRKELKGVNETIEIHSVITSEAAAQKRIPFFKDLWQRKVIQITLIYLVFAFLIRLSMVFFVNEYLLSPHLTNLVWYILLSLIPSIILIAYYHGKRDTSKWSKVEMIGLPVNIAAAVLVLVFMFQGKDLGAMTTKLTVEDENGVKIEKVVLKNEYRKNIYIYNFENLSGDTSLNYLQYSIGPMLEYDLSQDHLLTPKNVLTAFGEMAEAGYETGVGLPITLMKRMAAQRHMNYFMFGDLNRENGQYIVNVKVYDAKLTRLISEINMQDESIFNLVDQLSIEVKKAIGLPESHISQTIDLPINDIFTGSEKAVYYFSMAGKASIFKNWSENIRLLELALKEDPKFALAYVTLAISYFSSNNHEACMAALKSAAALEWKLPDQQQFTVKYVTYVLEGEAEKAMAVLKMWVELYPDDLKGHTLLAQRFAYRNMYDEAIGEFNEIMRLDPERYAVLKTLADYSMQLGRYDSALIYYQRYAEMLPQQMSSYQNLGDYYVLTGDMEQARENYNKALLLSDANDELRVKINLANVSLFSGEFDQAIDEYQQALEESRNVNDSAAVYAALVHYYLIKGQADKSLEAFENMHTKYRTILPPKDFMVFTIFNIEPYLIAGEIDEAMAILDDLSQILEAPLDNVVPFGYLHVYLETGEYGKAREAIAGAEDLIADFGEEMLMGEVYYAQGKMSEKVGEYDEAIEYYSKCHEINSINYNLNDDIARCYRLLEDYDKAEEMVEISLQRKPFNPAGNYEAAMLYLEMGDEEKGLEYLEKAVDIWKDADHDYKPANLAKEKLSSLRNL